MFVTIKPILIVYDLGEAIENFDNNFHSPSGIQILFAKCCAQ